MNNKLFVGNISWDANAVDLRSAFSEVGVVEDVFLVMDKTRRGRHKGYGFVTMSTEDEAQAAIDQLNETDLKGRDIRVSIAQPREE